ncbi:MAG TPA: septal ring lytic transglycosylase RlpA family protein [Solirubrobacterales bacterium]|nr:septal ring lytic transglycosylase RlpA family protein [Solirubrobacterales bacterium]
MRLRSSAVLALLAIVLVGAASAQASTGGAGMAYGGTAATGEDIAFSPFRSAGASWYGPGLWGNKTACGQTLRPSTLGVAHRNLPCGTTVKFVYRGRALVTTVIDRGPYAKGRAWDLTAAASEALEFEGVGKVRYAVAVEFARAGAWR